MISSRMRSILLISIFALIVSQNVAQTTRQRHQQPRKESLTARQIAHIVLPSIVVLLTEDSRGQLSALGSGFLLRGDAIVTNYHVIAGASRVYAKFIGQKNPQEVAGIIGTDKDADLALLKINGVRVPSLTVANSNQVGIGDVIYVIGNPEGLEGTLSQGIVSAVRRDFIQISAPISHGSSGSPVLNENGNVIGVAMGTFEGGQNLNFAIPSAKLLSLVQNTTAVRRFPLAREGKPPTNDPVSGEWNGTDTLYAMWDFNREDWSGRYAPSMARPRPFSLKLQLNGDNVLGTITLRDTNWTAPITGTWSDNKLTLRFFTESSDDNAQGTTSRLDLRVEGDSIWGEDLTTGLDDTRVKLKSKVNAVRKRTD